METSFPRRTLCVLIVLALLTRLGIFAAVPHPDGLMHLPDSAEYDRLAWNLVAHGEYSLAEAAPWTADLTRTPVFPVLVACCYKIAGHEPAFAVAVQVLISVLTVVLVYAIGQRFFDATTALVGAALLALDPLSIRYGTLLLSESLFTLLLMASLWCVLAYLRKPQLAWVAATTILTGLLVLCRPIAIVWPFALLGVFGWIAWRQRTWQPLLHGGVVLAGTFALVSTWVVRNYRVGGVAVLSTVQGINLYYYRAALTLADEQNLYFADAQQLLRDRLQQKVEQEHLDYSKEYSLMEKWGWEISGSAPKSYLRAHLRGIARMFLPQRRRELLLGLPASALFWAESIFVAILYGLALTGVLVGLRRPDRLAVLVLVGVVVYFAGISGPEAYARFRVPVIPALSLLAGIGLAWIVRMVAERRRAFA
jgi:4-amino-4-deoxy-L-arabinose transferase-like glycosyltransferase